METENKDSISLKQYLEQIKKIIESNVPEAKWIEAEIASLNSKSGHGYVELVELDSESGKEVAKARATIWKKTFNSINKKFYEATGNQLTKNIKVKILVQASFSELYSFALSIIDIDPKFTLGDIEVNKQKIIALLTEKGIVDNNKRHIQPSFFSNVAVISSQTAAGLQDFNKEADKLKQYGLCNFSYFYCSVQGADTEASVIKALKEVYISQNQTKMFDAVIIIRGGGSVMDLNWFNNLVIANAVCLMNLPVFIGIGHEKDKTVLDLVANRSFDTPSKVILHIESMILNKYKQCLNDLQTVFNLSHSKVESSLQKLNGETRSIIEVGYSQITNLELMMTKSFQNIFSYSESYINSRIGEANFYLYDVASKADVVVKNISRTSDVNLEKIISQSEFFITNLINQEQYIFKTIINNSVQNQLSRGFTLPTVNNTIIRSASEAKQLGKFSLKFNDATIQVAVCNN